MPKKDADMLDESKDNVKKEETKVVVVEGPKDKFYELKKNLVLLEKASKDRDFRQTAALSKNLKRLRKMYDLPDAVLVLSFYLPDLFMRLLLPTQPSSVPADTTLEDHLHCTRSRCDEIMIHAET